MPTKTTRVVVRWPTAAVVIAGIAAVTAVYVLVPEHRGDIGLGVAAAFALLLAVMRRLFGVAPLALLLAIAIPVGATGCGVGALAHHRRAATLMVLAEEVATAAVARACPEDEDRDTCDIARPAAEALGPAVESYREATKLAGAVEEGRDIIGPLCALARPVLELITVILGAVGLPPELDGILAFIRSLVTLTGAPS